MIEHIKTNKSCLEQLIQGFKKEPQFRAECALLDLTECICEINKKQVLPIRILIRIIQWCADKAIYWEGSNNR